MRNFLAIVLVVICSNVSDAQLALRPPGSLIPGQNWQPPLQSQLSLLAGQLLLETQQLKTQLAVLPLNPSQRLNATLTADRAIRGIQQFQKTAQSTNDRGRLLQSHAAMDAPLDALERMTQQIAPGNPLLSATLSRIQFADERIHAALSINVGPNPIPADQQRIATARIARAIADQTMELRSMLNDLGGTNYNVSLRNFASRATQIAQSAESNQPISVPQEQWNQLVAAWNQLNSPLSFIVAKNPAIRQQFARIDRLVQDLGSVLRGENIPPNPGMDSGFLPRTDRLVVVGAGEGGGPHVKVFHNLATGQSTDFFAYDPNYRGGVRVAVADLNGDGIPDIVTAPGRDHPPIIRVFNGRDLSMMAEFRAYDDPFDLGIYVAASDLHNGKALIAVGPGLGGPPHVKVFDLISGRMIDEFYPYPKEWRCGARVALGDVNGDLIPDLVTAPGAGVIPQINVYDGRNRRLIREIQAMDRSWQGGLFVSTGDITRNGRAEIIVGTDVGGPAVVRVFEVAQGRMISEFSPYPANFHAGARVALFDVNQDGVPDYVTVPGPAQRSMPLKAYDGQTRRVLTEFYPYGPAFGGGAFVASR
jgi:hypothetical protein